MGDDNAPFGKTEIVKAPWGESETASVFMVREWSGKTKYAVVYHPKHNKFVRCSVFKVDS